MEVHHHPKVEKKKFKEYFFEFIMIFLAVTMGFFAETIRENITEHRRAKEFAESMLQDLWQTLLVWFSWWRSSSVCAK